MALEFKVIQPVEYYRNFFEHKVRPDGRELLKVRPTSINIGSLSTADGSALVRLGNTNVICGIKAELALPKPDEPNKGYLVPNVELSPLCSAHFRPGPPSEQAQVSSQLVLKIINSSKCVHLEELCIQEGKLVWVLYCDIICLNYDGTIIDAAIIALMAALRNLKLPEVSLDTDTNQPKVNLKKTHPLNVYCIPVATTFALFDDDIILMDPTCEEECLASGVLTVASLENGDLCGVYKPGGLGLNDVCFQQCFIHVFNRGQQVRSLIDEAILALSKS